MTTKIQWTDVTWNPVVGCTKVSAGCKQPLAHVVAADELAGTAEPVEAGELLPATARADNERIVLPRVSHLVNPGSPSRVAVVHQMRRAGDDLEVLGSVVGLVMVPVVNDLSVNERPPDRRLGHKSMLVHVSPAVGEGVPRSAQENVAVRGYDPATSPLMVGFSRLSASLHGAKRSTVRMQVQ